ncbi:MAG: type II toxin-antitoxin system VapC family toxin [Flammeovirgaceae bacterium]
MIKNRIICDTDFLISLSVTNESTHQKALNLYQKNEDADFLVLNITMYEVATVLSRKFKQTQAVEILESIQYNFETEIWFEKDWQNQVFDIYKSQLNKNISFFDCSCLFLAQKYKAKIASFDQFYPPEILIG